MHNLHVKSAKFLEMLKAALSVDAGYGMALVGRHPFDLRSYAVPRHNQEDITAIAVGLVFDADPRKLSDDTIKLNQQVKEHIDYARRLQREMQPSAVTAPAWLKQPLVGLKTFTAETQQMALQPMDLIVQRLKQSIGINTAPGNVNLSVDDNGVVELSVLSLAGERMRATITPLLETKVKNAKALTRALVAYLVNNNEKPLKKLVLASGDNIYPDRSSRDAKGGFLVTIGWPNTRGGTMKRDVYQFKTIVKATVTKPRSAKNGEPTPRSKPSDRW